MAGTGRSTTTEGTNPVLNRRTLLQAAAAAPLAASTAARAQAANTLKIGVLCDMSGLYRDITGPVSVACARLAAQEFAATGTNVEVVFADHQNRPDNGASIVRAWFDRDGVDAVADIGASSVAFAVSSICREKNKVMLATSSGATELTGPACSPNSVQWTWDSYMLAKSTGAATVRAGGDSWFFITPDYAFGQALERDTANFVRGAGGRVLGSVRTPFPGTTDFSSFLLQAQASGAKVIALATGGTDAINCIKQAAEFGITNNGAKLAALVMLLPDVHALGLQVAQGLICTEAFYWDLNDRTRAFTSRIRPQIGNAAICMDQAGTYGAVLHYLKAAAAMGVAAAKADGAATVARMKAMPTDDDAFGPGRIREDGRKLHPVYLFEVKKPGESRFPFDYYKVLQTTAPDQAFRPLSEGGCPLVRS